MNVSNIKVPIAKPIIGDEEIENVVEVLKSGMIAQGPKVEEFEESFAYSETADQLRAVSDIKLDMESGKVMDRLICGDVGYGKTEVALRAAFKTILSGKQVALLCPTTILCEQHFNTIKSRFSPYAISYAKLNRFQTKKEQNLSKIIK